MRVELSEFVGLVRDRAARAVRSCGLADRASVVRVDDDVVVSAYPGEVALLMVLDVDEVEARPFDGAQYVRVDMAGVDEVVGRWAARVLSHGGAAAA